jgi:phenylalanyl-tRNA synthetase alpha chain
MKQELMSPERMAASLAIPDLTDPKNGIHAINIVAKKIQIALEAAYGKIIAAEHRTDPRVTVEENYDQLLFPKDNAGRSSRYTRYVTSEVVLRTHTSAAIPRWLKETDRGLMDDIIVPVPGLCYRRDVVDKTHCAEPHQMDIWRIKKGSPRLERNELIKMVETILESVIPGYRYRANEVQHPYTINGLEIEILVNGEWLEVLECGEAHPTILKNAGLDPEEYSGLAVGMGLDRLVMIIKKIDDIRVLRSLDPRVKKQMVNLETYIPVSNQPPAVRVLSYSASLDKTEEDICETIRDVLGSNSSYLEEIKVEEIPYETLDVKARENLGISNHQKNVVVTITLRPLEGSLPRKMVNEWMREIYPQLNAGARGYM